MQPPSKTNSLIQYHQCIKYLASKFQCKSESCCVWPLLQYTEPVDWSLFSICVTAQSCMTRSGLIVLMCLPPQATDWQIGGSYKQESQPHSVSQPLLRRKIETYQAEIDINTYCAGSGKHRREFKVDYHFPSVKLLMTAYSAVCSRYWIFLSF